ncbi:hypothetical protein GCM10010495_17420 [Kitasatospora herbaricolor]|nr:hypothetical protein GCM10010495_17420 [Kitasatospora herbaricolor]
MAGGAPEASPVGQALAERLGVPFHVASPDLPDDSAPRWRTSADRGCAGPADRAGTSYRVLPVDVVNWWLRAPVRTGHRSVARPVGTAEPAPADGLPASRPGRDLTPSGRRRVRAGSGLSEVVGATAGRRTRRSPWPNRRHWLEFSGHGELAGGGGGDEGLPGLGGEEEGGPSGFLESRTGVRSG